MFSSRVIVVALVAICFTARAEVRPAGLFTDNMVIQRDTQAAVWGWADAGEQVVVSGSWGASATATADEQGTWLVHLQTPEAGGPHELSFKGSSSITLTNVLSGDVWLCSGQSNMQWPVSKALNPDDEAQNATYPKIRHFTVNQTASQDPTPNCKGPWQICSPATVKGFSATAYFTGRELHKNLDVPIGLLTSAWGGTPIEAWTPLSEQADDPFANERKARFDNQAKTYTPEKAKAQFETRLAEWKEQTANAKGKKRKRARKPRLQTDPLLSHHYPGNLYNGMIHPLLPFAIKGALWYQGESNAGDKNTAAAEHYRVQLDRMIRTWRSAWGQDFPFYAVQLPNFRDAQDEPVEAEDTWPAIRESFVYVAQNTPGVATACMIDLGEAKDIHPKNKQDVGYRMASTILNKTYGKDTPITPFLKSFAVEGDRVVLTFDYTGTGFVAKGGELKGFAIAGADQVFVWADAEIVSRDGVDCVVVRSDRVQEPVSVRYAWADNPADANLTSKEGFPASPFRTDTWELTADSAPVSPPVAKASIEVVKSRLIANLDAGKKQTVVTYGTSLTAVGAWVDQLRAVLEQTYPGQATVINSGSGGSNSDWGRENFEERVLRKKPDTVFIEFAVNDAVASRRTTVEHAQGNLEDMLDRLLKARPDCEIILMVMNPPVAHTRKKRPNLADYNQMYRDVARARQLQLIDHYPVWETLLNEDPALFIHYVPDGIHPVREGALKVITPTLIKALGAKPGRPEASVHTPCWNYLFKGLMDKDKNRQVTRAEFTQFWAGQFGKQDADQNGTLLPAEYEPLALFQQVDADHDGQISLDEYQQIYVPHFDEVDKDNDDVLSKEEFWRDAS